MTATTESCDDADRISDLHQQLWSEGNDGPARRRGNNPRDFNHAGIDHAAAAAAIGMELRPTEVLIFGNPQAGTPLMPAVQTVGIDHPLKALVWQDEGGATWLAYNDPQWLARRHGADAGLDQTLHAMADALAAVAKEATAASAEAR